MSVSANPAEEMRWCSLGCGAEMTVQRLNAEGRCPKCNGAVVDFGWRYRQKDGSMAYVSEWDSLPVEVRRATAG